MKNCENLNSYELRDLIADNENISVYALGETSDGANGYPRNCRGTIDMAAAGYTFGEAEELARRYGLRLLRARKRDGWQFFECRGTAYEEYDLLDSCDDDDIIICSAEELREELKTCLGDDIREVENREEEILSSTDFRKQFVALRHGSPDCYDIVDRRGMSYRYDVWQYTILLYCNY